VKKPVCAGKEEIMTLSTEENMRNKGVDKVREILVENPFSESRFRDVPINKETGIAKNVGGDRSSGTYVSYSKVKPGKKRVERPETSSHEISASEEFTAAFNSQ